MANTSPSSNSPTYNRSIINSSSSSSKRFEGGECNVPPSLPGREALSVRKIVRDAIPQPVDLQPTTVTVCPQQSSHEINNHTANNRPYHHQAYNVMGTYCSIQITRSNTLSAEEYDAIYCINQQPSTSRAPDNHVARKSYGSSRARPPMSTLTRDVPDFSDEPRAAVDMGCLTSQASRTSKISEYENDLQENIFQNIFENAQQNQSSSEHRSASVSSCSSSTSTNQNDSKKIIALQWNISSLPKNLNDLIVLTNKLQPIVLALQETHVKQTRCIDSWLGGTYKWYLKSRPISHHSIALAVNSTTPHRVVPLKSDLLALAIQLYQNSKLTIVSIYVPPRNCENFENKLQDLLNELEPPFLLLGDFNAHNMAWGSPQNDKRGNIIAQMAEDKDLIILNDGSNTFSRGVAESAIDLSICSSGVARNISWRRADDTSGSDHYPIFILGNDALPETTRRKKWLFDSADWESYESNLLALFDQDPQYSIQQIAELMRKAGKSSIPMSSSKVGLKATYWWNPQVEEAVKLRRKALRKMKRINSQHPDKELYIGRFREARRTCRKIMAESKRKAWESFLDGINASSSPVELWRRINSLSGKRRIKGFSLMIGDTFSDNPREISEKLAQYFAEMSATNAYSERFLMERERNRPFPFCPGVVNHDLLEACNYRFSLDELVFALDTCKSKSCGPDGIGYPMIKKLPNIIKCQLLDGYNKIWQTGEFPDDWHSSIVVPIPKAGPKSCQLRDFRPISLTSCMAKLMERMVNRRLMESLEKSKLLDQRQFAFRRGKGAGAYFASMGEVLAHTKANNLHADIACLDISKAYNRVWRKGVLEQLGRWGYAGNVLNFINGFLANRTFRVAIGGSLSSTFTEENGVPQGSVLAVSLFLIVMNSVFQHLPSGVHVFVYADDIVIVVAGPNATRVRRKIQSAIKMVFEWASRVGFQMSTEKCEITHCCAFRHNPMLRPVKVNDNAIPFRKAPKVIGVSLDRNLNFCQHFQRIKQEVKSRVQLVKTISSRHTCSNRHVLQRVANALICSKLLYGIEITYSGFENLIQILGPVYNSSIRMTSGLLPSSPTLSSCVEAGHLPFDLTIATAIATRAVRLAEKAGLNKFKELLTSAQNLFHRLTNATFPPVSQLCRVGDRRWDVPAPPIDWTIKKAIRAGEAPAKAKAVFQSTIHEKYQGYHQIYTDGSRRDNKVGIGIYSSTEEINYRLPDQMSVFSAEAVALNLAAKMACRLSGKSVIFTDSASVLTALENPRSKHPCVQSLEEFNSGNIVFCWVPGHSGISGNVKADMLAGRGCTARRLRIKTPGDDIKHYIKSSIDDTFAARWNVERNAFLRKIKSSTKKWNDQSNRKHQINLSRLRVGHCRFSHPHVCGGSREDRCECGARTNTVEHVLVNCPVYDDLRKRYHLELSIGQILDNDPVVEENLLLFLKESGLFKKI